MGNLGTTQQRRGTFWICVCEKLFKYRAPSDRRPDRLRIRAGLCATCKRRTLTVAERELERMLAAAPAGVRVLDQWN